MCHKIFDRLFGGVQFLSHVFWESRVICKLLSAVRTESSWALACFDLLSKKDFYSAKFVTEPRFV